MLRKGRPEGLSREARGMGKVLVLEYWLLSLPPTRAAAHAERPANGGLLSLLHGAAWRRWDESGLPIDPRI